MGDMTPHCIPLPVPLYPKAMSPALVPAPGIGVVPSLAQTPHRPGGSGTPPAHCNTCSTAPVPTPGATPWGTHRKPPASARG